MSINELYTPKQQRVLLQARTNFRIMINYGAVRSGKTVVDNDIFIKELMRVRTMADRVGTKTPMFILAGVSSKTIQDNILQELSNKYGIEFHFDKHGSFKLFGVKVVQTFTGSIAGLGAIRGMTAAGAYVNEASLANQEVFQEIIQRCSMPGARIVCDTNPDVPTHWLKTQYIDNHDPKARIVTNHFILDDNTFLDDDYIESLKASTPSGMFYDRAVRGLWVSGEGMVYRDFDKDTMMIQPSQLPKNLTYYCGVDWGYKHPGSIVVLGEDQQGNVYLVEEHTEQFKEIDYWVSVAKKMQRKYGQRIPFYADTARTEHIDRFNRENIRTIYGNKSVLSGIEDVAKLIKSNKFKVNQAGIMSFLNEIYAYVWDERSGMPVKENDHSMDAIRYAIRTHHHQPASVQTFKY